MLVLPCFILSAYAMRQQVSVPTLQELNVALQQIGSEQLYKLPYNERYENLTLLTDELARGMTFHYWSTQAKNHLIAVREGDSVFANAAVKMIFLGLLERQMPNKDFLLAHVLVFLPASSWMENDDVRVPPKFTGSVMDRLNSKMPAGRRHEIDKVLNRNAIRNGVHAQRIISGDLTAWQFDQETTRKQ